MYSNRFYFINLISLFLIFLFWLVKFPKYHDNVLINLKKRVRVQSSKKCVTIILVQKCNHNNEHIFRHYFLRLPRIPLFYNKIVNKILFWYVLLCIWLLFRKLLRDRMFLLISWSNDRILLNLQINTNKTECLLKELLK